jgi:hypothetical protein
MDQSDGKNLGKLSISDGGRAGERRASADVQIERAFRELFFAMRGKDGKSINKNFRNVARGETKLICAYKRRIKELKAARNDAHNYPLAKASVREIDIWVDDLFGRRTPGANKPAA